MKALYLTSTFKNDWNLVFNIKIGVALEREGLDCYLPYRDTNQSLGEQRVFEQDMAGIENSKMVLAVGVNQTPNWGAEIGYAYAHKKPIMVLTTKEFEVPLICKGMVNKALIVKDIDEVDSYIHTLVKNIRSLL